MISGIADYGFSVESPGDPGFMSDPCFGPRGSSTRGSTPGIRGLLSVPGSGLQDGLEASLPFVECWETPGSASVLPDPLIHCDPFPIFE